MKSRVAGKDWEFDGSMITVRIPMTLKRRGGRKVIIAPDGGNAWVPAKPRPDGTLIRALARAHRWKRMLEEGSCRSAHEIAEAEGITRSFVNRVLRLTLLAPDIVDAIMEGRQPKAMQLEEVIRAMPSSWKEQQELLTLPAARERPCTRSRDSTHVISELKSIRRPWTEGPNPSVVKRGCGKPATMQNRRTSGRCLQPVPTTTR